VDIRWSLTLEPSSGRTPTLKEMIGSISVNAETLDHDASLDLVVAAVEVMRVPLASTG
jgi:hypothetical protein